MKTVYFVRHGETLFNQQKRLQGWNDSPLSPQGEQHARHVSRVIAELNLRRALVSPLGRARQTAEIIQQEAGIVFEVDPNLREVSFGDFEGKTLPELDIHFPGMWAARMADKWNYCPPNGEANKDAVPRARSVLAKIEQLSSQDPLLIIAHFAINRIILSLLAAVAPEDTVRINVPHGVIYRARAANGHWRISYLEAETPERGFVDGWLWQDDPHKPMGG
ncbi:MAG: histidine phosphatase family protein [bacterium]|jgi:probable phosphoglycerate mutase|nr:histidine phosphatase family protein [bacterium]